ncbi:hypothetical protein SK128_021123 [Halocaridina rubra]|uniref:Fatty acid hydroxylase domain-containing protein n=1 Tax=Halocaridina rubra TaxID=373956 RepID=A0AAN8XHK8_HALRR
MTAGKPQAEAKTTTNGSSQNKIVDPMAVTWTEKYSDTLEKYWNMLPNFIGTFIATVAVFILGSTIRGEWLLILVHFLKAFQNETTSTSPTSSPNGTDSLFNINLEDYKLQNVGYYWICATSISYIFYLGVGGFLHWYYYVRQRERAIEWKCQPNKFMPPDLERHEILIGSFSLLLGSTVSAFIACYVMNGGDTKIYYDINEYGWLWYLASWPVVFVWQDYLTYWHHRMYHTPFLYKNFHKLHHKYKQPTAFSVTAIHPVEFLHMQAVLISPMVLFPTHWTVFVTILVYIYYHGIIDHSGINFKAHWWQPWQPDCIFHDNHHQYFHVNFGFNCEIWDKIHGTYRQKNKVYREDIYYGKGKDINECTTDELKADLDERESENVLAYRGTVRDEQVQEVKQKLK